MTRILCLWLANWPIQRIVRSQPELKGRAVALAASGPRGAQVAVCSSAAVSQGVRVGMPVAEAQALAPQLAVLPHEPSRDRQVLAKLAEACERFTPCVGLEEGDEPESLLLDISNLEHLWGSEARLVAQVEKFFKRRGYRVRLAVGETIGLAWALAHFGSMEHGAWSREYPGSAPCQIPQSEIRGSTELAEVNPKSEIDLPVEALRITADTAGLLRELGVETIDQLMLLAREELTSRFGDELLHRLDQLTGAASEMIVPHRGLPGLEVGHSLDEPTADRAVLMHMLGQLVEQLSQQLAARDQGAVLLMCLLRCTGGNMVPLRIGLLQPTASARQLMELVELNLETVRLHAEVDRVEIRVDVVGRLGERQGELFADRWSSDPHQLALLVNRLSSRLGEEQVLRAELSASPVPERAVRFVSLTKGWLARRRPGTRQNSVPCARRGGTAKPRRSRSGLAHLPVSPSPPLPILLHSAPQALEVVCVAPDGPPQFVWFGARRQRIVHHAGPERIETLWWRGSSVRRDYYRVALESGSHLWIFRRLTDRRWFLHGEFV
ncbi:MAG TPA: DNA polymerase Y family protein [Lacipirellulaceae bacterium]|nr:DNA polymerase Y family protein [Lacipirellulaceae bacterium]